MNGTNAQTGKPLGGIDHLRQSIVDILTTPIGSRVMRRDYGSQLPDLVDAPTNSETTMDMIAAAVDALTKWEPRIALTQVTIASASPGEVQLNLTGQYLPDGQVVTFDGIKVN
jgi:phage baseplate assembly protein W